MGGGWEAAQDHVQWLAFILVGIEAGGTNFYDSDTILQYSVQSNTVKSRAVSPPPPWAGLFSSTWRLHSILEPTSLVEDPVPRRCGDCSRNVLGIQATKQLGHQNEQFIFEA